MGGPSESRLKMMEDVKAFFADWMATPVRQSARRFAFRVVSLWEARRARGGTMIFVPTIGGAIEAGTPYLTFHCSGCKVAGSVDLRTLDRHRETPVTGLIPSLSCQRCCPNPPFAKLDGLRAIVR